MCIFTSDKDIPGHVKLTTKTLQYLIIPLLSLSLLIVGILHIEDCPGQRLLPIWHIVAGSTGLLVPILYLLFDDLNPALAKKCPTLSEALDNIVVFVLPVYVLFELCWLITGTIWVAGIDIGSSSNGQTCDTSIYIFSLVVIVNFWIHILTPLVFMVSLCCSKIGVCSWTNIAWSLVTNALDHWTRSVRLAICCVAALPLGVGMLVVGGFSLQSCRSDITNIAITARDRNNSDTNYDLSEFSPELTHIPVWLLVAGGLVLLAPLVYLVYDVFCKPDDVNLGVKNTCRVMVIVYLLTGMAWAIVGFLWIFGASDIDHQYCGHNSNTYWFAFASLIILNGLMDLWICFKICVILYWAFLSEE